MWPMSKEAIYAIYGPGIFREVEKSLHILPIYHLDTSVTRFQKMAELQDGKSLPSPWLTGWRKAAWST